MDIKTINILKPTVIWSFLFNCLAVGVMDVIWSYDIWVVTRVAFTGVLLLFVWFVNCLCLDIIDKVVRNFNKLEADLSYTEEELRLEKANNCRKVDKKK